MCWRDLIDSGGIGFYQKCSTCSWVSEAMRKIVDHCPVCGSDTDPSCALRKGGLLVWFLDDEMYLGVPGVTYLDSKIQGADLPDVIRLIEHWKSHPLNPSTRNP